MAASVNSVNSDDIKLNVIINGDKAQKELLDLDQSYRQMTDTVKDLRMEKAKLMKDEKNNAEEIKRVKSEIEAQTLAMEANKKKQKEVYNEININNLSLKQLQKELRETKIVYDSTIPDSDLNKKAAERMAELKNRIGELSVGAQKAGDSMEELQKKFGINGMTVAQLQKRLGELKTAYENAVPDSEEQKQAQEGFKKIESRIKELSIGAEKAGDSMEELQKKFGINGMTLNQLTKRLSEVKLAYANALPNSDEQKKAAESFKEISARINELNIEGGDAENSFDGLISKVNAFWLAAVAAFGFVINKVIGLATAAFGVRAEFEKFEAVLTNTLGSKSAAQKSLRMISDFASKTPFQVNELTDSFVKMANRGFIPTEKELTKLGDLASSTGKPFDQLVEAILDAQTGENERLKEFGITGKKNGDIITYTFKGVETQVKNNEKSIRDYILSLGDLAGVSGSMAAISNTLEGQLSNLKDSYDALLNVVGERLSGVFKSALGFMQGFVGAIKDYIQEPMADKLRTEQTEINTLVGSIVQANIGQKTRNGLIDELQKNYPDFFKNISKETTSNGELLKILDKVNGAYNERIVMAVLEKENEKNIQKTIELETNKREAVKGINAEYQKLFKNLGTELTIDDKIHKIREKIKNNTVNQNAMNMASSIAPQSRGLTVAANDEMTILAKINEQYKVTLDYEKEIGAVNEQQVDLKIELLNQQNKVSEAVKKAHELTAKKGDKTVIDGVNVEWDGKDWIPVKITNPKTTKETKATTNAKKEAAKLAEEELNAERRSADFNRVENEKQFDDLLLAQEKEHNEKMAAEDQAYFDEVNKQFEASENFKKEIESISQANSLVESEARYNTELLELERLYAAKLISQTQYNEASKELEKERTENLSKIINEYASSVGNVLGQMLASNNDKQKAYGKEFISIILGIAEKEILIYTTALLAKQVSSKGFLGIATSAVLTGLITAAFSAMKSKVSQNYEGRYTVTGSDDNKTYTVPYKGIAQTGIIRTPSLVSENGSEAIIDHPTLISSKRDRLGMTPMDHFAAIRAIRYNYIAPVRQFAKGAYPDATQQTTTQQTVIAQTDPALSALLTKLSQQIENGIPASVNIYEFERQQTKINNTRNRSSL